MSNYPDFIESTPTPQLIQRLYNGRKLPVYSAKVRISNILGWIDNPRIDLEKKAFKEKYGDRELSQDEVFDIMKNDNEVDLKALRDDILKNGLREPLTISYTGKLLDGNRRFFAVKYALETMNPIDPNRQDLEIVPVFILAENTTAEDEKNVLVEENFSPSLKKEWPEYVKAKMIVEESERGISIEEISRKYKWAKRKVKETLRIHQLTEEFITFATSEKNQEDEYGGGLGLTEISAERICTESYQYFNEAQKSFFAQLENEIDFKLQFFRWIAEKKFQSFPEVRIAYKAWISPEARAALMQVDPAAAKSAKSIIDYNERVIKTSGEVAGRITNFVQFLANLSVDQIKLLEPSTCKSLEDALKLVINMKSSID